MYFKNNQADQSSQIIRGHQHSLKISNTFNNKQHKKETNVFVHISISTKSEMIKVNIFQLFLQHCLLRHFPMANTKHQSGVTHIKFHKKKEIKSTYSSLDTWQYNFLAVGKERAPVKTKACNFFSFTTF